MIAIPIVPGEFYTVKFAGQRFLVAAESGCRAIAKLIFALRGE